MLDVEKLPLKGEGGLIEELEAMADFRKPRGVRFSLPAILGIACCATLSGAKSFVAIAQWACDAMPQNERSRAQGIPWFRYRTDAPGSLSTFPEGGGPSRLPANAGT